ncbi:MAG: type I glutamate--ammonia ligase [Christensenellales bacterium]|jgi:glutamine synthetase
MKYNKQEIIDLVKKEDVKFIRLQFTDILGQLKNVAITASQLEKALDGKCMFDGSSIEGFVRIEESDMYLKPDLDTFVIFPWRPQEGKVARLICDVYDTNDKPFEGDPRYVLKKVLKKAADMGYTVNAGPEMEFFLFFLDETGAPTLNSYDRGGYFDISPVDQGGNCRRDICLSLEKMGFEIEASHHEVAPAQHEIDFRYSEALDAADKIMTFKLAAKSVAKRHGLFATFMPKPKYGVCGSGMHVNMSLSRDGVNAFYDEKDVYGLSATAYSFLAGVLKYVKELAVLTNPLINSYKRLVPGYEAPVYIAWSCKNRSPLIRIPASKGRSTRIELRNPDPSCNPYLAFAGIIAAGLKGIEEGLTPPPSVNSNIYEMSEEERISKGVYNFPETLDAAVECLEKSDLLKEVLGRHIFEKMLIAKKDECYNYRTRVSQWEIDNYLPRT